MAAWLDWIEAGHRDVRGGPDVAPSQSRAARITALEAELALLRAQTSEV
jgi:hypothetical protein